MRVVRRVASVHRGQRVSTPVEESGRCRQAVVTPNIVACIPCLNTEPFIGDVVLRSMKYVDQVVVVNDGSDDGTAETAKTAGAVVTNHCSNRGYGEAIKSCLAAAKGTAADVLVTIDGDGQHDPDEIPRVVSPIVGGEADIVIGSRFITKEHSMPRYRRFGIAAITFLWNFGSKVKVTDTQSGFRAYSRAMIEDLALSEKGMAVSIEILEKARRKGAVIKEVPISCRYDHRTINAGACKHGAAVALGVVRIRLRRRSR